MNLRIVAVGKLREAHYKSAVEEYLTRIRHFLPIEMIEVPVGTGEDANGKGSGAIAKEAAAIAKYVQPPAVNVTLNANGKSLSSEQFSEWLHERMVQSVQRVNFIIGGAWGLSPELVKTCDLNLSLSAMTLPHELARLVLTEQIYRALTLWKGHPYHK